jgi:SAM-dependent methyltransferase
VLPMLNRRIVNFIRWILEDLIPPVVRDSPFFYVLLFIVFKKETPYYAQFRQKSPFLSLEEYAKYYQNFPHLLQGTDINQKCMDRILADIRGSQILDAGCGRGILCENILASQPHRSVSGVDISLTDEMRESKSIQYSEGFLERLPYPDKSFDTVVCTHTLEHVLNLDVCLRELRRVTKDRLIIVVPREREYKYAFNLHLHFFPYINSFLNRVKTVPTKSWSCEVLDGDIYYHEDYSDLVSSDYDKN